MNTVSSFVNNNKIELIIASFTALYGYIISTHRIYDHIMVHSPKVYGSTWYSHKVYNFMKFISLDTNGPSCFRPAAIIYAITYFVTSFLGTKFVNFLFSLIFNYIKKLKF